MIYSYTQISQYLTCPRRYRHRYLDGWREKDTRAAMLFGRAFESALAAFFSAVKIRQPSCFGNGQRANSRICSTRSMTIGIECCSKAFSCSSVSVRKTASASASRGATCKRNSSYRLAGKTSS